MKRKQKNVLCQRLIVIGLCIILPYVVIKFTHVSAKNEFDELAQETREEYFHCQADEFAYAALHRNYTVSERCQNLRRIRQEAASKLVDWKIRFLWGGVALIGVVFLIVGAVVAIIPAEDT